MPINQVTTPYGLTLQDTLKRRLPAAIKYRKETQADVARHTGISKRVINSYCFGSRVPTVERLVLIAQALRVTPDFLLGFSNTPVPPKDSLSELLESFDEDEQKLVAALLRVVLRFATGKKDKKRAW
jgi:transcriptional regulator with XRE-family HTH domain